MTVEDGHSALLQQYDKLDTEFGMVLQKLRAKHDELSSANQYVKTLEQRMASLELAKQDMKLQSLQAMQREYDFHVEALGRLANRGVLSRFKSRGQEAPLNEIAALNRVLHWIKGGRLDLKTRYKRVSLSTEGAYMALRMTSQMEQAADGTREIHARETSEDGIHSIVVKLPKSNTNSVVSARVNIKAENCESCRVNLRSSANLSNSILTHVDMVGRVGAYMGTGSGQRVANATTRTLANGWIEVQIEGLLYPDGAPVEMEISTGMGPRRKFSGTPDRGMTIRRVSFGATHWEEQGEMSAAVEDVLDSDPEEIKQLKKDRSDARKRRTLRQEFLASEDYKRIAEQRGRYAGRRAFIIGNGPSINGQDLVALKDEITFVTNWFVNHPQYTEINPSYICVSSHEMFGGWNNPNPQLNMDWYNKLVSLGGDVRKVFSYRFASYVQENQLFNPNSVDYLLFDRPKEQVDIAQDINVDVSRPMLDGYTGVLTFCLPLAHHLGISEIYLVGCDCDYGLKTESDERKYFYDRAQHTSTETKSTSLMRVWADDGPGFRSYEVAKSRFDADGIPIVNLTAGGRLNVFPRADYDRTLKRILGTSAKL